MLSKTPVTILTGFLGAGKTTLIQQLIEQTTPPTRYGIIVNEFGEIDIDAQAISEKTCDDSCTLKEMPNGCICCTLEEDFLPTIKSLIKRIDDIDHIIIETSGLALPKPLIEAFLWPEVARHLSVDATLCLLDAQALSQNTLQLPEKPNPQFTLKHNQPTQALLSDQLICADLILLNKIENITENELKKIEKKIKPLIQPNAKIFKQTKNSKHITHLINQQLSAEQHIKNIHTQHDHAHDHGHDHAHAHDQFSHHTLNIGEIEQNTLQTFIEKLIKLPTVYRIKGYAAISNKPMRLSVQATGASYSMYFDRLWPKKAIKKTQLVIIAQHQTDDHQQISDLINQLQCTY